MRKTITALFLTLTLALLLAPAAVFAAGTTLTFEDGEGHSAIVKDDAQLFSEKQRDALLSQLKELVPYGNVGIETSEVSNSDAASFARSEYLEMFGATDGTLFLIDMYNRRLQIFSGGSFYRILNRTRANEITDNIYTYASDGDYYTAAKKAFEQIKIVMEGGRIVAPMRYATNAALAIGIVLLVNFIIIMYQRRSRSMGKYLKSALQYSGRDRKNSVVKGVRSIMTKQTKTRKSESSGGGGGGGFSGGGGGGGGGGGFSGGGGGHSF